jgi:hypothetical protein
MRTWGRGLEEVPEGAEREGVVVLVGLAMLDLVLVLLVSEARGMCLVRGMLRFGWGLMGMA